MLLLDKPSGPTSHDMVDAVRRSLGTRRVGHGGTLDPFASGLLVILVGRATRLAPYVVGLTKRYEGAIRLGVVTDSDDRTGIVEATHGGWREIETSRIEAAMLALTGRIVQRPPVFSARKRDGERAYRLARRGQPVTLEAREVEVCVFALTSHAGSEVRFEAEVGSGTYIRSLARDLGEALGCGAHLEELRRTAVGPFAVVDAETLDAEVGARLNVRPPREAVPHLPARELSGEEYQAVRHGRPIACDEATAGPIALVSGGQLVAIAEPAGEILKPKVVLVDE